LTGEDTDGTLDAMIGDDLSITNSVLVGEEDIHEEIQFRDQGRIMMGISS
jgi:hypothetical protein